MRITAQLASLGGKLHSIVWRCRAAFIDVRKLNSEDLNAIFSRDWYRRVNGGPLAKLFPWSHYLLLGGFRGAKPSPTFDSAWYLAEYPDVRGAGVNPLLHYLNCGAREGRNPSPYFDSKWYCERYPDVLLTQCNALAHFLRFGAAEGRDPNAVFSTRWYMRNHPEIPAGINALEYFIEYGARRGDIPGPLFDPAWYLFDNLDVAAARVDPLIHYLQHGRYEGRAPSAGRNHFMSVSAIRDRLAMLPPSQSASAATARLAISSVSEAVSDPHAGLQGEIVSRGPMSARGVANPVIYPVETYVARLSDVYLVAGTRYAIGGNGSLLHEEEAFFATEDGATVKYRKARRLGGKDFHIGFQLRQLARVDEGINLMHEYSSNYFHFVAEVLPRLLLAEEAEIPRHVPLLIEVGLHANLRRLLDYTNSNGRAVIELERGTLYHCRSVYIATDPSVIIDAYVGGDVVMRTALDVPRIEKAIRRCLDAVGVHSHPAGGRKIYAGRTGSMRALLNQAELEHRLLELGFEAVYADTMTLAEQIRVFSEADVVVGPTGAQMTNLVWCKPGTRVTVLASDHHSHQLYLWQLLGEASGVSVSILQGPRAYHRDDLYSVHDDYSIDVDKVVDALGITEHTTH
jgi:capsular polysaccharide biosynthesis protein